MKPLRFYEHFACGFGTLFLAVLAISILTQSHINTGVIGLVGFPIFALIYAFIRISGDSGKSTEMEEIRRELDELRHFQRQQMDRSGE